MKVMKKSNAGLFRAVTLLLSAAMLMSMFTFGTINASADVAAVSSLSGAYEYVSSDSFNFATQAMWDNAYREADRQISAVLSPTVPAGSELTNSVYIEYDGTTGANYPCLHFIDNADPSHRYSYGNLFGAADISEYDGIVLWIKQGTTFEPYNKRVQVLVGNMTQGGGYNPGGTGNFYVADCAPISTAGNYYYIPFADFKNSGGTALDPSTAGTLNFISFKTGVGTATQVQQYYVGDLRMYRNKTAAAPDEYVRSDRFNTATNADWSNNVREGRRTGTEGEVISDTYATISTDPAHVPSNSNINQSVHVLNDWTQTTAYPAIHFFTDTSGTGYSGNANRPLWTSGEFVNAKGIRIWAQRAASNIQPINIVLTVAGSTSSSTTGSTRHFRYKLANASLTGAYYDIPFSLFLDYAANTPYNPAVNGIPNSIGFKSDGTSVGMEYYFADLQLIRQPVRGMEYVSSGLFNNSTSTMWSQSKFDGTTTYANVNTNTQNIPANVSQSVSFGQVGTVSNYPAVHFWNMSGGGNGATFGDLFGATDTSQYTGIRLWIKKGAVCPYSRVLVFIDRLATGAAIPTAGTSRYIYNITGAEFTSGGAYIDIPFSKFYINNSSANPSFDPAVRGNINYIAFQSGDGSGTKEFEVFISDLQLYRSEQTLYPTAELSVASGSSSYVSVKDYNTGAALTRAKIGSKVTVDVTGIPVNTVIKNGLLKYRVNGQVYPLPLRKNSALDIGGGVDNGGADSFFFTMPDGDAEIFLDTVPENSTDLYTAGLNALAVYEALAIQNNGTVASSLDFSSRALKSISYNGDSYELLSKGTVIINDSEFSDPGAYFDWAANGGAPLNAIVKEAGVLRDDCNLFEDYTLSVSEVCEKGYAGTSYAAIAYADYEYDNETIRLYSAPFSISYNEAFASQGETLKTILEGKRVLWLGTSIPAGSQTNNNNYPYMVGQLAGASAMYNMSVGTSPAAAGMYNRADQAGGDPLGVKNAHWEMASYGLSQSVAEKQDIINNFASFTFYQDPGSRTEAQKAKIIGTSYERRVDPYISGNGKVDVVMYNHGYNDFGFFNNDNMQYGGFNSTDRSTFYGATNFILDRIKAGNPAVKIVIVGHYSDLGRVGVSSDRPDVNVALKAYAEAHGYLYLDIAPLLGDDFYESFSDGIHPHIDSTGAANMAIANAVMITLLQANTTGVLLSKGDVNGDTLVNSLDIVEAKKHVLGLITLVENKLDAADVDNDGFVTVKDIIMIKRIMIGLLTEGDNIEMNQQNGVFPMLGNSIQYGRGEDIPENGEGYQDYNSLKKAVVTAI